MSDLERESLPTAIHLEPVAAPSILGLYGLAAATFIVAAYHAGWFGGQRSGYYLLPFAAALGGLAQFVAGMWAYKARDGVATALHGIWGAFWLGYAALGVLMATGVVPIPNGAAPELGYWFAALAAITWVMCPAAAAENRVLSWITGVLALGSTIEAIALFVGSNGVTVLASYIFMIAAVIAWYGASALMLDTAYGRVVWPVGKRAVEMSRIAYPIGEPGVIRGQ